MKKQFVQPTRYTYSCSNFTFQKLTVCNHDCTDNLTNYKMIRVTKVKYLSLMFTLICDGVYIY